MENLIGLFEHESPELSEMECAIAAAIQNAVPACSICDLQPELIEKLFRVWRVVPFICTSAYRSVEWDCAHGRSGTSSHCKGLAVDIACLNNRHRFHLVEAALNAGFLRIGIAKNFIHLDCDSSKYLQRIWTYDDYNKERKG